MVSLNKITLEKKGDSHKIDLSKSTDQQITINLNWTQQKTTVAYLVQIKRLT